MTDRPTFDETYPRYEFAELVRLGIAIGRTVHCYLERQRTMSTIRKTATVAAVTVLVASAIMPVLADDSTHAKLTQPVGSQPMELTPTSRGDRSVIVLTETEMDKVAAGTPPGSAYTFSESLAAGGDYHRLRLTSYQQR